MEQVLFDGVPVAAFVTDGDRRITHWNSAATRLFGCSAAHALGQMFHEALGLYAEPEVLQSAQRSGIQEECTVEVAGMSVQLTCSPQRAQLICTLVPAADSAADDIATLAGSLSALCSAVQAGDMSSRVDYSDVSEAYQPIVGSVNRIIDALSAPLRELMSHQAMLAEGDLTAHIQTEYEGEHAQVKDAFNNSLDTLDSILSQVQDASDKIASGASEVSSSSHALSIGATKQAAAVEEISASITEMAEKIRETADNAKQASGLADTAGSLAQAGDDQMREMVQAMSAIEVSSNSISRIIKVIDEIAFQTNLLALNAAVEAARAGSHGKGFAVVAEEVRNLAARSANAAKETTAMIEDSIKNVNHGTDIATKTAGALAEIVDSVQQVNQLVADIAQASGEQAQGIAQVDTGLKQVDQVTQQNTASAEESAAAAEELSSQAGSLREQLTRFTLQPRVTAPVSGDLSPELLAAVQAYLAQQGGAPEPAAARPPAAAAFDGSDFGRY